MEQQHDTSSRRNSQFFDECVRWTKKPGEYRDSGDYHCPSRPCLLFVFSPVRFCWNEIDGVVQKLTIVSKEITMKLVWHWRTAIRLAGTGRSARSEMRVAGIACLVRP